MSDPNPIPDGGISVGAGGISVGAGGISVVIPPGGNRTPEDQFLDTLLQKIPQIIEKKMKVDWKSWQTRSNYLKPEIYFGSNVKNISLSPVGILHIYRQYFFELSSFPGPSVEQVWVSPGGTVELFEMNRRQTLTERTSKFMMETKTTSEISTTTSDELSTVIKVDNQQNENLGVTTSAGGGFPGIFHADATINYGVESSNKESQEIAHKEMRQQSERLSSEITKSFETTFKTSVETEDIISKRHVIQNPSQNLKNYELLRKMRKVGIQVQHIGSQLCWQFFVDDPGQDLGLAELVHIAKPADLTDGLVAPEFPKPLKPISQETTVDFPWSIVPGTNGTAPDKLYAVIDGDKLLGADGTACWRTKTFVVQAPEFKYKLTYVSFISVERTGEGVPVVLIEEPIKIVQDSPNNILSDIANFTIALKEINFGGNAYARLKLKLIWSPTINVNDQQIKTAMDNYEAEKNRRLKEAFVDAVKERITLASKISKRPFADLRKEERICVYRRLISELTGSDNDLINSRPLLHTVSELIKTIFDIDKMLYFVAPDWWNPRHSRKTYRQSVEPIDLNNFNPTGGQRLSDSDLVAWGGSNEPRPNYLITEDSEPAEMGSSIGWLMQLDGDEHRNAFLNSPWVKAVIPIRPGMETQAMNWLSSQHIEGSEGLRDRYMGDSTGFKDLDADGIITLDEVIQQIGKEIEDMAKNHESIRETEKVYEKGFDPLPDEKSLWTGKKLQVFDQWIEIVPTDQIVAVEYDPTKHEPGDIIKSN